MDGGHIDFFPPIKIHLQSRSISFHIWHRIKYSYFNPYGFTLSQHNKDLNNIGHIHLDMNEIPGKTEGWK